MTSGRSHSYTSSSDDKPLWSTHPVAGTKRYEITDEKGITKTIYTNYDPRDISIKVAKRNRWIICTILLIAALIFLSLGIADSTFIPQRIHTGAEHPARIIDMIDRVEDEAYLKDKLTQYYKATGLEVAIYACPHDYWEGKYDHQGIFCDEMYWSIFSNDRSLLIMYSEPQGADFLDWEWSLTIGDDTWDTASDAYLDALESEIIKRLNEEDPLKGIADALIASLDDRKVEFNFFVGIPYWIFTFIILAFAIQFFIKGEQRHYYPNAKPIEDPKTQGTTQPLIIKCSYCEGTYGADVTTSCPHCGAPVEIKRKIE